MIFLCIYIVFVNAYTNFVLLGSNGDLARRYLWGGLFQIYNRETVYVYGGGRKDPATIEKAVRAEDVLGCENIENCDGKKQKFWQDSTFVTLKKEEHFETFCKKLNEEKGETARIFYLSIPPFAFAKTAEWIHKHCRSENSTKLRVAFEKPFGESLAEANKLIETIALDPSECFLIDHYLGKPVIRDLMAFREANYEDLWTPQSLHSVEVYFHESLTVKGRTSFYDSVGVIKDVMQNHLTEFMMRIIQNESGLDAKNAALRETSPAFNVRLGQYDGYLQQLQEETGKTESKTPTKAEVQVEIQGWPQTEFMLAGAKSLRHKKVYARVATAKGEIFFIVSVPGLKGSAIAVSRKLPKPVAQEGWALVDSSGAFAFGELSDFWILQPLEEIPAYHSVLNGLMAGSSASFVRMSSVPLLWKIWDDINYTNSNVEIYGQYYDEREAPYIMKRVNREEL